MFLGKYDFDGDPAELLPAYDRLMAAMPVENISFHVCIRRPGGITIYDTCPSAEVFAGFASNPDVLRAMSDAGLPAPVVTPLGDCHRAMAVREFVI